jgi:hypothetical protein
MLNLYSHVYWLMILDCHDRIVIILELGVADKLSEKFNIIIYTTVRGYDDFIVST